MKLIVALGNPGIEYEKTRHNAGWIIIDQYLKDKNLKLNKKKFNGVYTIIEHNNEKIILSKPLTYMNLSGNFVSQIKNFYKLNNEDIIVIHDDKDIELGNYKIQSNRSSAGHNGVEDIINSLKTKDFLRVRIGIKNLEQISDIKRYVLERFTNSELDVIYKLNLEKILEGEL